MGLSVDEVRRIAELARLRLSSEEEERFSVQLGEVVEYFDQLRGTDVVVEASDDTGESREFDDRVAPGIDRDDFLSNAPATRGEFLLVPAVKEDADDG